MAIDIPLAVWKANLPKWLPSARHLVRKCKEHGHGPSHFSIPEPGGSNAAFVKYGPNVAMSEARTQNYLATEVNKDENIVVAIPEIYYAFRYDGIGYILMQHVGDDNCTEDDFPAIVTAVERLLRIPNLTAAPGPIGGGHITHRFFADQRSSVHYDSIGDLQDHVNGILNKARYGCSVNFNEAGGKAVICFDDLHMGNFRKDKSGLIYSVDHAATNFLPLVFRRLAFAEGHPLAENIGESLGYTLSGGLGAIRLASGKLQLHDNNLYGMPKCLQQSVGCRDLFE